MAVNIDGYMSGLTGGFWTENVVPDPADVRVGVAVGETVGTMAGPVSFDIEVIDIQVEQI
jgi:hypothetical protein